MLGESRTMTDAELEGVVGGMSALAAGKLFAGSRGSGGGSRLTPRIGVFGAVADRIFDAPLRASSPASSGGGSGRSCGPNGCST